MLRSAKVPRTVVIVGLVSASMLVGAGCEGVTNVAECDSNYEGACLHPGASDYDCEGGEGDGPLYTGEVTVVGTDRYGLDSDGDGVGCEGE